MKTIPLWIHCMQGDLEAVKRALQAGQDPNQRSPFGVSCLMHSARRNHPEIMELLLCQPGVDINTPDNSVLVGGTPLHWAVSGGSARMVEMLLKQPNLECLDARDVHGYTPLMLAVGSGSCDLISLLMKRMLDDHRLVQKQHDDDQGEVATAPLQPGSTLGKEKCSKSYKRKAT